MELGVFFVFIGGFAICAGLVFVISVFGVQSETFEEALEKQKNQNKDKKKEKKNTVEKKKKPKKSKESKNNNVQDTEDENLLVDPQGDIVEPVIVEPVPPTPPSPKKQETPKVKKEEKKKEQKKKDEKKSPAMEKKVVEKEAVVEEKAVEKVEVVEAAAVEEVVAVVETAAVQQAAPPKEVKPQKKKIEIIEVAEIEDQEEKKKNKPNKEKSKKAARSNYEGILEVVRKAALSDKEAQGIVDILLLKQTGREETEEDWIEQGKESETKKMARRVAELQVELEEESVKAGNLEKKMITLRKELNESKSQLAGYKRDQEDMNNKKTVEISALNTRLQQVVSQYNSTAALNRQLETNQSHYQATINSLQTQLSQVSSGADPKLLAEMEQIKSSRNELTASNHTLQQSLTQKCAEFDSLAAVNKQLESVKQQLEHQLAAATEEKASLKSKLEDEKSGSQNQMDSQRESLRAEKLNLETQLSAVTAAKQQTEMDYTQLKEKLAAKEIENSRILEELERLSEQVASSVERPAAEGEESTKLNGHSELQASPQVKSQDSMWEEKYSKVSSQLKEIEVRYADLEKDLEKTKSEASKLRAKNDEEIKKLAEHKQECRDLFSRLFPQIPSSLTDLQSVEKKAQALLQDLEGRGVAAGQTEELAATVSRLEAQNTNYKTVLAQTENMLTTLQSSVESAEATWQKKLESEKSRCRELISSETALKATISELKSQVDNLQKAGEKLEEVRDELETERTSKDMLAKKCAELQQLVTMGQQHINNHTNDELVSNGSTEA